MVNLNSVISLSLDKYFTGLSSTGYHNYLDTYRLILLIGLRDILNNFDNYITEDDLRYIMKALNCLNLSCLIDMPVRYTNDSLFHPILNPTALRKCELDYLKLTLDSLFRSI